jgi:hypothetical protein
MFRNLSVTLKNNLFATGARSVSFIVPKHQPIFTHGAKDVLFNPEPNSLQGTVENLYKTDKPLFDKLRAVAQDPNLEADDAVKRVMDLIPLKHPHGIFDHGVASMIETVATKLESDMHHASEGEHVSRFRK